MSWDEQRSRDRVKNDDFSEFEVNVADLKRTMDFHNLGTRDVRRAQGAHIYADIPNFHQAVADAGGDKQKQKKLLRAASVLRKIQGEVLEERNVGHIQRQATRLHALCYKPYDDDDGEGEKKRAECAVVTAISLNSYLYDVFNDVFSEVRNFDTSCGIAAGQAYIANIGFQGGRELISLGSCANLAAKVIDQDKCDSITVTEATYKLLPNALKEHFEKSRTVHHTLTYQAAGLRWSAYPDLADTLEVSFDQEKLKERTETCRDTLPLSDMEITEAIELIDITTLTERNSKRTSAAAIYADLDGFTKYVQEAEDDDKVVSLVRIFHMIRHEFHAVIKSDYPGLVLQHQGDRTFAIMHLPSGDKFDDRCNRAVDIVIGLQSSMEHVLNEHLGDRKDIHVAVGVDIGQALVTRLGKRGRREMICLGEEVSSAEALQLKSSGRQIRISEEIYNAIKNETKKGEFKKDDDGDYVAKNLTFPRLDELEAAAAAKSNAVGAGVIGNRIAVIVDREQQRPPQANTKPWSTK